MNVRKVCTKCGRASMVRPRARRCKIIEKRMGARFYCYGELMALSQAVVERRKIDVSTAPGLTVGLSVQPIGPAQRRPQDVAQRSLEKTRKAITAGYLNLTKLARQQARQAKRITRMEAAAARYAKRASMTDAEVQAERDAREARSKARVKKTRQISLEE